MFMQITFLFTDFALAKCISCGFPAQVESMMLSGKDDDIKAERIPENKVSRVKIERKKGRRTN